MKITRKGIFVDDIKKFNMRPNICSFEDGDGATFNINTITLITMYNILVDELTKSYGTTVEEISKTYNK